MSGLYVYDAAYRPNLASVKSHGGIAINGYLTGQYARTTTQPQEARSAGLGFVPTYEEGRSELVGASRYTGRQVADRIIKAFRDKGIPIRPDIAVYPSVDVAVAQAAADSCNDAWQGMRDVFDGSLSLRSYAEGAVIDALWNAHLLDGKCWLSASTSFPGFNVNDPRICMVQLVGSPVGGTDADHLVTDPRALGAWWPDNSPYAVATPKPQKTLLEEIVSLPGAPQGLTYQELLADVAKAVATSDDWHSARDKYQGGYQLDTVIRYALTDHTLDPGKLAASIAKALPAQAGISNDQLVAAVETGVREVFADAATPSP